LNVVAGKAFSFAVKYNTSSGDNTLTGLGLRIHYNSQVMTFANVSNILQTGYVIEQGLSPIRQTTMAIPLPTNTLSSSWADIQRAVPKRCIARQLADDLFTLNSGVASGTAAHQFQQFVNRGGHTLTSTPVSVAAVPGATVAIDNHSQRPMTL